MRIGQGYDAHRFGDGRPLVLGGVTIPHPQGLAAHSDGDVLIHALCDALLGAAGLGGTQDLLQIAAFRGRAVDETCRSSAGGMAAVFSDQESTSAALEELALFTEPAPEARPAFDNLIEHMEEINSRRN